MNLISSTYNETINSKENNPFFTVRNSQVVFYHKKEKLQIDLNLISNVRIIKNRVFYFNILFTFLGILGYLYLIEVFQLNLSPYLFPLIFFIIIYLSFLYKQFSYKLIINKRFLNFYELKVPSKKIAYAQYFMLLHKKIKEEQEDIFNTYSFQY